MAIISKGAKVFINADGPVTAFDGGEPTEPHPLNSSSSILKDYYGDISQAQQDLIFQPAGYVGTATGKTSVLNGTLYYEVLLKDTVSWRTSGGIFGWGAGEYKFYDMLCWISSEYLTDSEANALEKYNKRTDGATLANVKKSNSTGTTYVPTGNEKNPEDKNTQNNSILYVLGAFILVGLFYLGFRKK